MQLAAQFASARRAVLYTLFESAKYVGVKLYAYLTHVLTELPSPRAKDLDSLFP